MFRFQNAPEPLRAAIGILKYPPDINSQISSKQTYGFLNNSQQGCFQKELDRRFSSKYIDDGMQ